MEKVEAFNEEEMAKGIKLMYVELQLHEVLYQSGLSIDEQIQILNKVIETRRP
ncbi:hypothetical protein PP175_21255 [Aneurinibacillus sp. Ricciae_BoGa-3]|uniref:hypothetical protein n=1 Tax=Aneurinibacillus sp. Ricciae_BoGa-3 TaxID=3022697 RepID=UPI002340FFF8|nr:hypothetical protein [Aneurinibacillus sp. Ricciae_BoGa-3]WCK53819.1 hypothetical protein PP175_21255 [Aneurinibacillus sp. Ricciae_BoGa-3]